MSIGDIIAGRFEIREIHSDDVFIAYVCYDRDNKTLCILKTLQEWHLFSWMSWAVFEKEAENWISLGKHPHIIHARSILSLEDRLFIIHEYIAPDAQGRNTLAHYIGSLSSSEILDFSIQFCHGMEYVHSRGIVHGHIEPDSIAITTDKIVKINDFGIIRALQDVRTRGGIGIIGTSAYMAPEQFDGRTDGKSDIYSFGVVLYQMASDGVLPFVGTIPQEYELLHRYGRVPPLPSPLFLIIQKCLEKNPKKRFKDFTSIRKEIQSKMEIEELALIMQLELVEDIMKLSEKAKRRWQTEIRELFVQIKQVDVVSDPKTAIRYMNFIYETKYCPLYEKIHLEELSPPDVTVTYSPIGETKPDNILITPDEKPKVIDFGVVKAPQFEKAFAELDAIPAAEIDKYIIVKALRSTRGDKIGAAKILGISRPTLIKKIKDYGISIKELTHRYTDVSFPAEVHIDKYEDLQVAIVMKEFVTIEGEVKIRTKLHEHDVEVEIEIPERPVPIIVDVLVTAPDFEIQGDRFASIEVPVDADSEPAIFKLKGKEMGRKEIVIDFFQDRRYLGVVNLKAEVIEAHKKAKEGDAISGGNIEIGAVHDAPDLTLLIQEFSLPGPSTELRYTVVSPQNKLDLFYADFGSRAFSGSIKDWVEGMVKRIEEFSKRRASNEFLEDRLTAIGNNLYEQVIPEKLKSFYWNYKDRVKSMVIVSDEPWIPWEIVKPFKSNDTIQQDDFLCNSFSLSRWLRGSAPPPSISLTPGKVVGVEVAKKRRDIFVISRKGKKKTDLAGITREMEFIRSLKDRGLKVEVIPAKSEEVYELLRSGKFKLFHLCSHGAYNSRSPDHSFVELLDGSFSPEDIVGKRLSEKPFVFLNVCHAARSGYSLTRIGSWASRFSEAGCSGFIGPLWSVDDELAYHFAKEFYSRLLEGIPLGEAFRQAREQIRKQNPSNPTWRAYCLYGNPLARIS